MTAKIDGTNGLLQQYDYQVSTTGFSYTFAAGTTNLVMNPAGTLATGTITMPAAPADGMTITFSSTQAITALTVAGNTGQSIVGNPTSMSAGGATTLVYRLSNTTWYAQTSTAAVGGTAPVVTIYTSPATWTKSASVKAVKVTICAGGGGGSGHGNGPGLVINGGAGAGATGYGYFPAPAVPGPVTVTVGSGGAGGPAPGPATPTAGGTGGTSSFGALISATGGVGVTSPSPAGTAGGTITPSSQIFGINGLSGSPTGFIPVSTTANAAATGNGAPSIWGQGGLGVLNATAGNPGRGYGTGASSAQSTSPGPRAGGTGGAGFIIVEEFY